MKTNNLFLGSALALALVASGASFAATTVPADPAAVRAEHRAATANMTQAEREAYRAQKQAEMTPEQRAAMRASSGKGSGTKVRDGSGAGKMHGAHGGGMGQGKGR